MSLGMGLGKRIVVIGGSAAGAAAAARAKKNYPNAQVLLFEGGPFVSYGACEIPFFLGGEIESIEELQLYTPQRLATEKNIEIYINTKVLEIDRRRQVLMTEHQGNIREIAYDKLIVSSGSKAKKVLNAYGHFTNVFSLKNLMDGERLRNYIQRNTPRKVIILGAGYIALEIVEAIRNLDLQVVLLNIEELPLPGFSTESREVIYSLLVNAGIEYLRYSRLSDFSHTGDRLKGLLIDGEWKEADLFIEAMGVVPNSQLAQDSGLLVNTDLTIKVDRGMKTSSGNIFAAGDVTHGFHALTAKPFYFPLAQLAFAGARVAADNLFSSRKKVYQTLGTRGLSFAGLELVHTGFTFEEAQYLFANMATLSFSSWNKPQIMPDPKKIHWNVVYQKNNKKIYGATIWGENRSAEKINTIGLAIKAGISIPELAEGDFLYAPRFSPMHDGFQIMARLIDK